MNHLPRATSVNRHDYVGKSVDSIMTLQRKSFPNLEDGFVSLPVIIGLMSAAVILTAISVSANRQNNAIEALERVTLRQVEAEGAARLMLAAIEDNENDLEIGIGRDARHKLALLFGTNFVLDLENDAGKLNPAAWPSKTMDDYVLFNGGQSNISLSGSQPRAPYFTRAQAVAMIFYRLNGQLSIEDIESDFSVYPTKDTVDPRYASSRVLRVFSGAEPGNENNFSTTEPEIQRLMSLSPHFGSFETPFTLVVTAEDQSSGVLARVRFEIGPDGRAKVVGGAPYVSPLEY